MRKIEKIKQWKRKAMIVLGLIGLIFLLAIPYQNFSIPLGDESSSDAEINKDLITEHVDIDMASLRDQGRIPNSASERKASIPIEFPEMEK